MKIATYRKRIKIVWRQRFEIRGWRNGGGQYKLCNSSKSDKKLLGWGGGGGGGGGVWVISKYLQSSHETGRFHQSYNNIVCFEIFISKLL